MQWTECHLTVNTDAVESVCFLLYDSGINGLELVDNTLSPSEKKEMFVDYMDEKLEVDSDEVSIKFYLSQEENVNEKISEIKIKLEALKEHIDLEEISIETNITDEEDWAHNWKKYYKPFRVDGNIIIKPTWETIKDVMEEDVLIDIDPGMAFGSGTHETTAMCISLINQYLKPNDCVIDVGCGSGILGIAAAKLGAGQVVCIDLDKHAVKVAKDNVQINHVENKVKVYHGDLLSVTNVKGNMVVANIMADIIMILTDGIKSNLTPKGIFIASGIILDRLKDVETHLIEHDFEILEVRRQGEWSAIAAMMKE